MSVSLTYFDARGLCEVARWILSYGGIEFIDNRVPVPKNPVPGKVIPEDIKAKLRWGQFPLAEFEGKSLTQASAVTRFFARKCNLIPEDPYLAALCDEYVDTIREIGDGYYVLMMDMGRFGKVEEAKMDDFMKSSKTRFLDVFESIVKENGGKFLLGKTITWADIWLAYVLDQFHLVFGVDLAEDYEHIKALQGEVMNNENIKAWLEKRPKTKY